MPDLPIIWAGIIAFSVLMYVVMDGFDLGVGILLPATPAARERDLMVHSIAPVWDGNETWLVLGGGALMAAFPLAYSVVMTAVYAPLIAMLLGLVLRGVAFEFRFKEAAHKRFWDVAFVAGSAIATFSQGIVLGAIVQGIEVEGRMYSGGWFGWLTAFSLFTGLALVAGYALLGCCWLVMKTDGALQERHRRLLLPLGAVVVAAIAVVSLWTPWLNADIARRWFSWPNIAFFAPVPALVAVTSLIFLRAVRRRREVEPFLCTLALFTLSFVGLGISLYPNIVPPHVSIWHAASPAESQLFLLAGTVVLLPVILFYVGYSYWVFRGKVRLGHGTH